MCDIGYTCKYCDKTFDKRRPLKTTAFHQIKQDITEYNSDKAKMVVDLGCPNSVLGACDVDLFVNCLFQFQQENMEMIEVDETTNLGRVVHTSALKSLEFPLEQMRRHFGFLWPLSMLKSRCYLGITFSNP
jgi:hypothetical protein